MIITKTVSYDRRRGPDRVSPRSTFELGSVLNLISWFVVDLIWLWDTIWSLCSWFPCVTSCETVCKTVSNESDVLDVISHVHILRLWSFRNDDTNILTRIIQKCVWYIENIFKIHQKLKKNTRRMCWYTKYLLRQHFLNLWIT